jgi:hypothetical protein
MQRKLHAFFKPKTVPHFTAEPSNAQRAKGNDHPSQLPDPKVASPGTKRSYDGQLRRPDRGCPGSSAMLLPSPDQNGARKSKLRRLLVDEEGKDAEAYRHMIYP